MRTVPLLASAVVLLASGVVAGQAGASQPPSRPALATVAPTKLLTILEENHSYDQMKAGMPYLWSLAQKYGYATNWSAIRHPSLPNYLAIAGGSTFGVTNDGAPSVNAGKVGAARSVFDQAIDAGKTAKLYLESMPANANCKLTSAAPYAVKHNPWAYFASYATRDNCNAFDVPFGTATGGAFYADATNNALPTAGMVVPNVSNDAHNGSLSTADNWLKARLGRVLSSTDFTSGRLVVVITADEASGGSYANKVLTVVVQAGLNGKVVTAPLTHYSLTRYYAQVVGVTPLLAGVTAADLKAAFGL